VSETVQGFINYTLFLNIILITILESNIIVYMSVKVSCRCLDNILKACAAQFVFAILIGNVFGSVQIDLVSGSFSLQPACGQLVRKFILSHKPISSAFLKITAVKLLCTSPA